MKTFVGGVRPKTYRFRTARKKIRKHARPAEVHIPVPGNTKGDYTIKVSIGDTVEAGTLMAESTFPQLLPVHASVTGKVTDISESLGARGLPEKTITIRTSTAIIDEKFTQPSKDRVKQLKPEDILDAIQKAGVVRMDGKETIPHLELREYGLRGIKSVIVAGIESEPFLTYDTRLLTDNPKEVIKGALLAAKCVDAEQIYIAVDITWKMTIENLEEKIMDIKHKYPHLKIDLVRVKQKYPIDNEKQLVQAVLGVEIPPNKTPADIGSFVLDASTSFAIYEAVYYNKPLIERVVTVSGDCVESTENFLVRIGTPVMEMVKICGGFKRKPAKLIIGGPLAGQSQTEFNPPVTKTTTGVVFLSEDNNKPHKESECIRCAKCIDVCPMQLLPLEIAHAVSTEYYSVLDKMLHISDCTECNACSYICPSHIALAEIIKEGKHHIQ